MNMYIPRSVKEGTRRQRSTSPGPNVHAIGLHQKMLHTEGWERFLSNADNKSNFIALFVKFLKSREHEEFIYIAMFSFIFVITYLRLPASQKLKLSPEDKLIPKKVCFTIWHHSPL